MFKNYFLTSLRSMVRNRAFSFINLIGLAAGLSCFLLILIFVTDELSYDQQMSRKDRIYRLRYHIGEFDIGRVPPVFKEHLNEFFPEVEASARLFSRSVSIIIPQENGSELRFEEDNVNFSDPELFDIFDFNLVSGSLDGALEQPFSVILNSEMAEKYFKDEDAVGKTIIMEGDKSFEVVAVVEDFPPNTHTHFQMLLPYDNMYDLEPETLREGIRRNFQMNWMVSHSPTYVLLKEGEDYTAVNDRFADWVTEKIPENMQKGQSFEIQPLLDIHLNEDVRAQAEPSGSPEFIFIFSAVGLLTLLIACINYINLSTAKSLQRTKEIGMRKAIGASRGNVVVQFLGESFLLTLVAAAMALLLTGIFLPRMNSLTDKDLDLGVFLNPEFALGLILVIFMTTILAGLYPAFFVSKFPALNSISGNFALSGHRGGALSFRRILIVLQFSISILLISSTLIIYQQFNLFKNQALGFNKNSLVTTGIQSQNFNSVFGGVDEEMMNNLGAFEAEISRIPGMKSSSLSSGIPGFGMVNRNIIPEGFTAEDNMLCAVMSIDYDFIPTYEMEMVAGRNFDESFGTDPQQAFLINESAAAEFQFGKGEEALGKQINLEGKEGKVVGIVKDFNFLSLTEPMRPLILEYSSGQFNVFTFRIGNQNIDETLEAIESQWNLFFPNETFDHSFVDEALVENYRAQERFGQLIGYFAFLAILISCLGSYGLILFVASQKEKEIGIRKVLGAQTHQIVLLLNGRFTWPVLISMLIAWPATFYLANLWLEDFSYRIDISPLTLIAGSLITMILVFGTISIKSIGTALLNPAEAMKRE